MTTSLRPMNLGELLDRSFFLYRKHFLLFVGIAALPQLVLLAFQLAGIVVAPQSAGLTVMSIVWPFVLLFLSLGTIAASQAATVVAVSKVHLGASTDVSQAFPCINCRI